METCREKEAWYYLFAFKICWIDFCMCKFCLFCRFKLVFRPLQMFSWHLVGTFDFGTNIVGNFQRLGFSFLSDSLLNLSSISVISAIFGSYYFVRIFYCLEALMVFRLCFEDLEGVFRSEGVCIAYALLVLLVNVSAMEQGFLCKIVWQANKLIIIDLMKRYKSELKNFLNVDIS